MPSPVLPSQFCDAIPSANADFCTRFTKFLNIPSLLCDLFSWLLDDDGMVSETFKAEVATYSTPTGMFAPFGTQNVGTGWLFCDGSEVSRTTYAALFNAIGTRYGIGDGSTTFNLPDCRGRSPIGAGAGDGLTNRDIATKYVGEETHLQTEAELVSHLHDITAHTSGGTSGDGGHILNQADAGSFVTHQTELTGGGQPFNVIHPCFIAYWYIKT